MPVGAGAIIAIAALALACPAAAMNSWCNVTIANHTVSLGSLTSSNFTTTIIENNAIGNVTLDTGFCATTVHSACGVPAVFALIQNGRCLDAFESITGPAEAVGQHVVVKAWSTMTTAVATVTFRCNPAIPTGTAVLAQPVQRLSVADYTIDFNTAAVC
uniref:Leishmanolysin-like peptidase n=1 Tax=Neobodo designis TaxID=312471 RepID=A0A7S1L835_NEODS